jgi:hypothetical protein
MIAKDYIKKRNLRFLHPDVVAKSDDANVASILKACGYFRNFPVFKVFYSLLYKSTALSLEQYGHIYAVMVDYKKHHPCDFFIDGFSAALSKSTVVGDDIKALYGIMIHNQMNKGSNLFIRRSRLEKAVADYYAFGKPINVAVIRKAKVLKISNWNLIKSIAKWNR